MSSNDGGRLRPIALRSNGKDDTSEVKEPAADTLHPVKIGERYHLYGDKTGFNLIDENCLTRAMTSAEVKTLVQSFPSVHGINDHKEGIVFLVGKQPLVDKFPLSIGGKTLYVTKGKYFSAQDLFPEIYMGYRSHQHLFQESWREVRTMVGLPERILQGILRQFPTCTSILRLQGELYLEFADEMPKPEGTPILIAGLTAFYSPVPFWTTANEAGLKDRAVKPDAEASIEDTTDYCPQLCPGVKLTNYKGVSTNSGLALRNEDGRERFTVALHGFLEAGELIDRRVFHPDANGQVIGMITEIYADIDVGLVELAQNLSFKNELYFDCACPQALATKQEIIDIGHRIFSYGAFDASITSHKYAYLVPTTTMPNRRRRVRKQPSKELHISPAPDLDAEVDLEAPTRVSTDALNRKRAAADALPIRRNSKRRLTPDVESSNSVEPQEEELPTDSPYDALEALMYREGLLGPNSTSEDYFNVMHAALQEYLNSGLEAYSKKRNELIAEKMKEEGAKQLAQLKGFQSEMDGWLKGGTG
ncbi:hypothetical protein ABW21_db0201831 [Orbilia brochopaga]|nr:hypothetical protein ABW21_db0201831 [Drechslerella brochopaga]